VEQEINSCLRANGRTRNCFRAAAATGRLVDYVKSRHITALFTNLTAGGAHPEETDTAISSLIDTWLLLRQIRVAQHRQRTLEIIKSRGMAHSDRVCAFHLTPHGIALAALDEETRANRNDD